jgi:hypothetical protein
VIFQGEDDGVGRSREGVLLDGLQAPDQLHRRRPRPARTIAAAAVSSREQDIQRVGRVLVWASVSRGNRTHPPAVEDLHVVLGGVGPEVQLDHPDAVVEGLHDGPLAAPAAQLVPRQVRVVARVDEVVRQRQAHVLVYLHYSRPCSFSH